MLWGGKYYIDNYTETIDKLEVEKQAALDSAKVYEHLFVNNYKKAIAHKAMKDSLELEFNKLSDITNIQRKHENELTTIRSATIYNADSIFTAQISEDRNNR